MITRPRNDRVTLMLIACQKGLNDLEVSFPTRNVVDAVVWLNVSEANDGNKCEKTLTMKKIFTSACS